jgi:hypothetical protein
MWVWWVGRDYLFGTAKDLREKYQERYASIPSKKVQGSSVIPLHFLSGELKNILMTNQ